LWCVDYHFRTILNFKKPTAIIVATDRQTDKQRSWARGNDPLCTRISYRSSKSHPRAPPPDPRLNRARVRRFRGCNSTCPKSTSRGLVPPRPGAMSRPGTKKEAVKASRTVSPYAPPKDSPSCPLSVSTRALPLGCMHEVSSGCFQWNIVGSIQRRRRQCR